MMWYHKRVPPIFCEVCRPMYVVVYNARLILLVLSLIFWVVGMMMMIGTFIACVTVLCSSLTKAFLIPVGLMLMIIGYLVFHCAWAAYLLDEPETNVYTYSEPEKVVVAQHEESEPFTANNYEEDENREYSGDHSLLDPQKYGHWKFVGDEPWQIKCSPNTLN